MTVQQITERIEKAVKRLEAKKGTIEKKKVLISKKTTKVLAAGYHVSEEEKQRAYNDGNNEIGWTIYEIYSLEDDIQRNYKEIPEIEALIDKYNKQLEGQQDSDNIYKNLPEVLKRMEQELFERWKEYDLKRHAELKASFKIAYETMEGYRKWMKEHSVGERLLVRMTEAEIIEDNKKAAKSFVMDLYRRVNEVTGEVVDYSGIYLNGHALNGVVVGKRGKAVLETILAGGYNIQKLHCRCLVKEVV